LRPRYYLNLWDGDLFEVDQKGTELPDVAAARAEALRFASEIMSELQTPERARIEMANEDGSVLWRIAITIVEPTDHSRDHHSA
jgi:hypothetical protein